MWMKEKFRVSAAMGRTRTTMGRAVLMQDGTPCHTSKSMQFWLTKNLGEGFWPAKWWPPFFSTAIAFPLDYSVWNKLVRTVCSTSLKNQDKLIQRLQETWHEVLNISYICKTCSMAFERLWHSITTSSTYIETYNSSPNNYNYNNNDRN